MAVLPPDKRPMKNFSSKKKGKKGKRLTREERLKKRKNTRNMVLGGIFFVFLLIWWGTMPIKGGIDFGICRTFAELREEYPSTMKIRAVETFDQALRATRGPSKIDHGRIQPKLRIKSKVGTALDLLIGTRRSPRARAQHGASLGHVEVH